MKHNKSQGRLTRSTTTGPAIIVMDRRGHTIRPHSQTSLHLEVLVVMTVTVEVVGDSMVAADVVDDGSAALPEPGEG